jgi:transcriptional regulator with XRE-family HTH domain
MAKGLREGRDTTTPSTGISLDGGKLRAVMVARGLSAARLAELSKTSPNTMTRAMAGRPISTRSARRIAETLDKTPVVAGLSELLAS